MLEQVELGLGHVPTPNGTVNRLIEIVVIPGVLSIAVPLDPLIAIKVGQDLARGSVAIAADDKPAHTDD
jgi:hypothetical protein